MSAPTVSKRDWRSQPPYLYEPYASTVRRSPRKALVPLEPSLSELTGPAFGSDAVRPEDADLTRIPGGAGQAIGQLGEGGEAHASRPFDQVVRDGQQRAQRLGDLAIGDGHETGQAGEQGGKRDQRSTAYDRGDDATGQTRPEQQQSRMTIHGPQDHTRR